jgi:hypothetical protein
MSKFLTLTWLILSLLISSCAKKNVSDCDDSGSSSGAFEDKRYDCPTGNPTNNDITLDSSNYLLGTVEAGYPIEKTIKISNKGLAKIFDFKINVSNATVTQNSCPDKFLPEDNCLINIRIEDTISGQKNGLVSFSDKTGIINKSVPFSYKIISSYPLNKEILFEADDFVSFDKMKISVGPLVDRFGNIIKDPLRITSNRVVSLDNVNFQLDPISSFLDSEGKLFYFLKSDNLQQSQLVDSAELNMELDRVYTDPNIGIINETFSVSFLNNKPRISSVEKVYNINEDDVKIRLVNLTKGEDYRGLPVSYRLTVPPSKGVISNCLQGNVFVTLITCVYTPNPNFNGNDFFKYKAWNGESLSFEEAQVKIVVSSVNDAPVLSGLKNITVFENNDTQILLPKGFDVDGDSLTYLVTVAPSKGTFSCSIRNCVYKAQSNLIDNTDYLVYKVVDGSSLESSTFRININILDVNEKPLLGGNEIHSTIEDTPVNITLTSAVDLDKNDNLIYKIKSSPVKGTISNCLKLTSDLSCTYTPNKNEDSADTFSYVAIDSKGLESESRSVSITISQVNDAPYFVNKYQEVQTLPASPVNFNILSAIDPEENSITYAIVQFPTKGNLSLSCRDTLSCSYTPFPEFNNEYDEFVYQARDQLGEISETRTVRIIIGATKLAPTLIGSLNINLDEDEEFNFNLLEGNDSDTPQEFLEYFISSISPQNGTIKNCMDLTGSDGDSDVTCTYIPNSDFVGTDQFSYSVSDGGGQSSSELIVNINVNQINDAPIFQNKEKVFEVLEDSLVNFSLENATDLENDILIYSIKINAEHGVFNSDCLTNSSIDCSYTPSENFFGEDFVIVEVADVSGLTSEFKYIFNVSNVNDAPEIGQSLLAFIVQEDSLSDIILRGATDIDSEDIDIYYRLDTAPTKGFLSNCLGINGVEGLNCKYITQSNEVGIDSFSYKSFDGTDESLPLESLISIEDVNDEPFFQTTKLGLFRVEQEVPYFFRATEALDLENDDLTYELINPPTKGILSNCFGLNGIDNCSYTASENETGNDVIVYRSKDLLNNSFNDVQIDFSIEEAKFARIFKLKTNTIISKNESISLEDKVFKLGNSLIFNNSSGPLSYVLRRNIDKTENSISGSILKFRSIQYNDELFSFETTGTNNTIKVISKDSVSFVNFNPNYIMSNPVVFNNNIYWGSNQSTIYRLNLTRIGQENKYYVDKVINKSDFLITGTTNNFTPITSFNGDLFFKYQNDSGKWFIAKMNSLGKVEKISNIKGKLFNSIGQIVSYDNDTNLKRVFITVKELDESQRIYVYDYLQSNINERFYSVTANKTLQSTLSNGKLFKGKSQDFIIFKDTKSKKAVYLRPDILVLDFVSNDIIKDFYVSEDKSRLLLDQDSVLKITDDNPILGFNILNINFTISKIDSFFGNRFFIKDTLNNYHIINDSLLISEVITPTGFNFNGNKSIFKDEVALWSSESGNESLYLYKENFNYSIPSSGSSYIDGLIGLNPNVDVTPSKFNLMNCLGSGSSQDCLVNLISGSFGTDSFIYSSSINSVRTSFSVKVLLENSIPREEVSVEKKLNLLTLNHNFNDIIDYVALKDEFYITVFEDNKNVFYKLINENIKVKIYESQSPIINIEAKGENIFFTDSTLPNKVFSYNQVEGDLVLAFEDTIGVTMEIKDTYINSDYVYYITRNYGNPARDRLIKQSLQNLSFIEVALPSGLINGKIFPVNNYFYIVAENNFAKFNDVDNTFVSTQVSSSRIRTDLSTSIDQYLMLVIENPFNNNEFDLRYFDTVSNVYETESYLFNSERIITNNSISYKKTELISLGSNSPYIYINEATLLNNGVSLFNTIVVNEKDKVIGSTTPLSSLFKGTEFYSNNVKKIEGEYYFISENELKNKIVFNKVGFKNFSKANYKSLGKINLPKFIDEDKNDVLSYDVITNPTQGYIDKCLGINSDTKDLICEYYHTGEGEFDSLVFRAFDGKEFSESKTVSFYISNTAPRFENNNNLILDVFKNISTRVNFDNANDAEGNSLFYVVDSEPSNGTLSNCNLNESNLVVTNNCMYFPNNNFVGVDSLSFYVTDKNKRTVSKLINITVSDATEPIFLTGAETFYINNLSNEIVLNIPKAYDPNGNAITYEIIQNPTSGTITNCFIDEGDYLSCKYTPNNNTNRNLDSFFYRAFNGTDYSTTQIVDIEVTGSSISGNLGSFILSESGPSLIKDNVNNLIAISSIIGYDWNPINKILTLPAGRYDFSKIIIEEGTSLVLKPIDEVSGIRKSATEFIELYSQSSCIIDGSIIGEGGFSNNPENDVTIILNDIDNNQLSHLVPLYQIHGFGGRSGGSSSVQRAPFSDFGTPSLFRGAEGQLAINDSSGDSISGGLRGYDGAPLLIKCLSSISGLGEMSVSGLDAQSGISGKNGTRDDSTEISYGGGGGSAGGNGGHSGTIFLISEDNSFTGDIITSGGIFGTGGLGGDADTIYNNPFFATRGSQGESGVQGEAGSCLNITLEGIEFNCSSE